MELSSLIRQYREEQSLSMQQFADRCNLSKGYISMLEKGRHPQNKRLLLPSLETFKKLSVGMNIPLSVLFSLIDAQDWVDNGYEVDSGSTFPIGPDEIQLIEDYREASEEMREEVSGMLHRSAERNRKDAPSSTSEAG